MTDAPASIAFLLIANGDAAGQKIPIDGEIIFGRDYDGLARLGDDPKLSRRHARVATRPNGLLFVEDLGSANGTWVNGERVSKPCPMMPGDVIKMGNTLLHVRQAPATKEHDPDTEHTTHADAERTTRELAQPRVASSPPPIEQIGSPSSIRPVPLLVGAAPPPAAVVHGEKRLAIGSGGLTIGRTPENDIVIDSDRASRRHAKIDRREGRHYLLDLGSMNGTYLNGERLVGAARWLNPGDAIAIGGQLLHYLTGQETRAGTAGVSPGRVQNIELIGSRMTIGRDPANDLVLDAPNISRFHAEVVAVDGAVELHDLGSRNGTRVDGQVIRHARLAAGSEIGVGPFRLVFDGRGFIQRDDRGALRLDSYGLCVRVGEKTILNNVTLSIQPGEFIAVIGESGAGKTTLIRALAGVSQPTAGAVCINGEPVGARLTDIGYLPQDEIVHPRLAVAESLRYAARLRLPHDSSQETIDAAVVEVIQEVDLGDHEKTRIESLSGGQRKRVGLATELLNRPGLLFLDEPTTGLDPGLETRLMRLFRQLAAVGRHAVFVNTHATRNLDSVDKLCVMGRGGELCYLGPPSDAKEFFAVADYDDIYGCLENRAVEWRRRFEAQTEGGSNEPGAAADRPTVGPIPRRNRQAPSPDSD